MEVQYQQVEACQIWSDQNDDRAMPGWPLTINQTRYCTIFTMHVYEVQPRKDKRGVDLISDVLSFGRLWYDTPNNAIGYAMHFSRSADAVIRVTI